MAARKKNVIDMAITFTAMNRIFESGSKAAIAQQLEICFDQLVSVRDTNGYEVLHASFCNWFTTNVRTAEKLLKNKAIKPSRLTSYGQAAKVLDIAVKVYVYYCRLPSCENAGPLLPFLHGAVDTPILKNLRRQYPTAKVSATTIESINRADYLTLQGLVLKHVEEEFDGSIWPVQYDDIMWQRLNRG
jgi:hypothetical protein